MVKQESSRQQGFRNLSPKGRRGFALMITVVVMVAGLILCLVVLRAAARAADSAARAKERMVAFQAAEAGLEYAVWRLNSDETFQGVEDFPAGHARFTVTVNDDPTHEGRRVVVSEGSFGRGHVRVREVVGRIITGEDLLHLGDFAVLSDGNIGVRNQGTVTGDNANVHSNSNVTLRDQASINGRVSACGTVTILGQSTINDPEYPEGFSGAPRVDLPDRAMIDAYAAAWREQALAGGTISGISGGGTIQAPVYVDGNIDVCDQSTLDILGPGRVVYVRGDVIIRDQSTVRNEGILVVEGRFVLYDQCNYQALTPQSALVSLAEDPAAIELRDQVNATDVGLLWAANGGIKMWDQSGSINAVLRSTGDPDLYGIDVGDQCTVNMPLDPIDFDLPEVELGGFGRVSWQQL